MTNKTKRKKQSKYAVDIENLVNDKYYCSTIHSIARCELTKFCQ